MRKGKCPKRHKQETLAPQKRKPKEPTPESKEAQKKKSLGKPAEISGEHNPTTDGKVNTTRERRKC